MSDQNKQTTRRLLEEMFERGNLEAADELVHPRFVNHEAPPGSPQGPEGLKGNDRVAA
jgi:predicted SnoaL-like aldol condensation-catalyzing enzyme